MKLIEAKAAKEFASTFFGDPVLRMAVNAVADNAPGFDLVRCHECEHFDPEEGVCTIKYDELGRPLGVLSTVDYCSDGERKDK